MVTAPRALLLRNTTFNVWRHMFGEEVLGGQREPDQHLHHVEALAEAEPARVAADRRGVFSVWYATAQPFPTASRTSAVTRMLRTDRGKRASQPSRIAWS